MADVACCLLARRQLVADDEAVALVLAEAQFEFLGEVSDCIADHLLYHRGDGHLLAVGLEPDDEVRTKADNFKGDISRLHKDLAKVILDFLLFVA